MWVKHIQLLYWCLCVQHHIEADPAPIEYTICIVHFIEKFYMKVFGIVFALATMYVDYKDNWNESGDALIFTLLLLGHESLSTSALFAAISRYPSLSLPFAHRMTHFKLSIHLLFVQRVNNASEQWLECGLCWRKKTAQNVDQLTKRQMRQAE